MKIQTIHALFVLLCASNSMEAFSQDRVQILEQLHTENKFQSVGPNCYSTSLYAAGALDSLSLVSGSLYGFILKSPYCQKVKAEERTKGDLAIVEGFQYRWFDWVGHGAFLSSKDQAISKMGFENKGNAQNIVHGSLEENIGVFVSKDCQFSLRDSKKADCREDTNVSYYRCDIEALRKFLFAGEFSQKINSLSVQVSSSLVSGLKIDSQELEHWQQQLNEIDHSMAIQLKKKFPEHRLTNHLGLVSDLYIGNSEDYFPAYVYKDLSFEFQIAAIEIMMLTNLKLQLELLK